MRAPSGPRPRTPRAWVGILGLLCLLAGMAKADEKTEIITSGEGPASLTEVEIEKLLAIESWTYARLFGLSVDGLPIHLDESDYVSPGSGPLDAPRSEKGTAFVTIDMGPAALSEQEIAKSQQRSSP